MSQRNVNGLFGQWFAEYIRLVYYIAHKRTRTLLWRQGRDYAASELEDFAQDAVCRGLDRFIKRCWKSLPNKDEHKKWVVQCMVRACQDSVRNRSRFGTTSDPVAIRNDAMHRWHRVRPDGIHGKDCERKYLDPEYTPVMYPVQGWEIRQLAEENLPAHLVDTAVYAAVGVTQELSASIQGVTDRTIRNRLAEARAILDPRTNIYAVICAALRECLAA